MSVDVHITVVEAGRKRRSAIVNVPASAADKLDAVDGCLTWEQCATGAAAALQVRPKEVATGTTFSKGTKSKRRAWMVLCIALSQSFGGLVKGIKAIDFFLLSRSLGEQCEEGIDSIFFRMWWLNKMRKNWYEKWTWTNQRTKEDEKLNHCMLLNLTDVLSFKLSAFVPFATSLPHAYYLPKNLYVFWTWYSSQQPYIHMFTFERKLDTDAWMTKGMHVRSDLCTNKYDLNARERQPMNYLDVTRLCFTLP